RGQPAGSLPRCDRRSHPPQREHPPPGAVHRPAVQLVDRAAVPAHAVRGPGLRAKAAGGRDAPRGRHDRRHVVRRLRQLDVRPLAIPRSRRDGENAARLGCHLMLWVVPYISPDSPAFRDLEREGLLLRAADGLPAIRRWWNGFSAILDLSDPAAVAWFHDRADALIDLGVDGFKFDGADVGDFRSDDLTGGLLPVDMCREWSRAALRYPLNELRASWDMGGQALAQRVQDKPPAWGDAGIESLIPQMILQSLLGYSYCCPDMVGGGEITAMRGQEGIDQEFFVRYAQVAALSPMIQFS